MKEYTNKFREYIVRCNLKTDDRLTITRFRDGLRNDIRREVAMFDYTRVDEAFCKARKAQHELQLRRSNTFQVGESSTRRGPEPTFHRTQTQGYRPPPPKPFQQPPQRPQQAIQPRQALPQQNQRVQQNQNDNHAHGRIDKRDIVCHACKQKGHYAAECPHRNLYATNEPEDEE